MKQNYDIAILGAGSGGLVVASAAASMGAKVLLVENRKMGGDCLNYGCVPSKAFLKSAHLAHSIRKADRYGLHHAQAEPSLRDVMGRVSSVIGEIAPHDSKERYEGLGVDVKIGQGKLESPTEISVDGTRYTAKKIVIATGSTAFVPPISGLDTVHYHTNESIFALETLPKRLVVLGAGPIGLELGQGFAHLGSEVHVVDRGARLFGKDEPEVAPIMERAFQEDGMQMHMNSQILQVHQDGDEIVVSISTEDVPQDLRCDTLLVALGRVPNTKNIGLETVGVQTDERGFIKVNDYLQSNVKTVYACGDCKGKFLFTHAASYEAGIVVKNALIANFFKTNYENMAWTTYTVPEIAHVGALEQDAKQTGRLHRILMLPIGDNDRAKAEDDRAGFVKVLLDAKKRVIGATIVGERAGEMLPILSMMVTQHLKISSILPLIYQYPIQGEILKSLSLQDFKETAKPWQKNLLKKIVTR